MRPVIAPVSDNQNQKNFSSIREALGGNLSFDNMNIRVISGTTANTPDTQYLAIHSMTPRPIGWFPLVGDVYVDEISNKYIDVRSTKPGVNFKIVLLGGSPVTGESLVAIGNDSYQPTPSSIFETATTSGSVFYGEFDYLIGKGISGSIYHLISDDSYFYFTSKSSSETNYLFRCDRNTGELNRVQCGASQLGPVYNDGVNLWTIEESAGANLYQVSRSTFTLTATIAMTYSSNAFGALNDISDIYVDGANVWLLGNNGPTTAGGGAQLSKNLTSTGAEVGKVISAVGTYGKYAHQIGVSDNSIYYTTSGPAATPNINLHKVSKTLAGTITAPGGALAISVYTNSDAYFYAGNAVYYNGYVYAITKQRGRLLSTSGMYGLQLMEYNDSTGTFSFYPIFETSPTVELSGAASITFSEIKLYDQFLFFMVPHTGSLQTLTIFDTSTKQMVSYLYPLTYNSGGGNSVFTSNRIINVTPEGGIVLSQMGTSTGNPAGQTIQFYELRF